VSLHFTYIDASQAKDLQQGDILKRTTRLEEILNKYHPYYCLKDDYSHFLVLTQSCDLVRRGDTCESNYITLAAIRPLSVVLEREAARYRYAPVLKRANAVSSASRRHLDSFLRKLLNNNNIEYFYLHEDAQIGLVRSCAFLRLSIAIKVNEHYSTLLDDGLHPLSQLFRQSLVGWSDKCIPA
jgi:hypothetical protein